MSTEEKEDKVKIPKFTGDKDEFVKSKIRVSHWEKKKGLTYLTSIDKSGELPSTEEYDRGTKTLVDEDGDEMEVALTDAEKKLFEDNAMQVAEGEKESVYNKVKKWLEEQFGEVEA